MKPGIGLFGRIKWTDIGKKLIENRVFRFLSPSWWLNDKMEPVEMTSVALTNKPAIDGNKPIVNSAPVEKEISTEETKSEGILSMTKEELAAMVAEMIDAKIAEAKKAEVVEEVKEEVKEEVVDNGCSEDKTEEVANEEPEKVEETKAEEVVEKTEEVKEEEKKEDKDDGKEEVIKLEALNAAPKTEGIDVVKHSAPKATDWRNLHGKAFIDWMNGGMK